MRVRLTPVIALAAALATGGAAPPPVAGHGAGAAHGDGASAAAPSAAHAGGGLSVRVNRTGEAVRLSFLGGRGQIVRQDAHAVTLRFREPVGSDVGRLVAQPPAPLKSITPRREAEGLTLTLTFRDGVSAKVGRGHGAITLDLTQGAPGHAAAAEPAPHHGPVAVEAETVAAGATAIGFPFTAPTGAAVFRRGGTVWIVFDAEAPLDAAKVPISPSGVRAASVLRGPGWTAMRLTAAETLQVSATAEGAKWTVRLDANPTPPVPVAVERDDEGGATLTAALPGARGVHTIVDPVVGDTLTVVTALGPAKGAPSERSWVEMTLLPSAQGLAVAPRVDDLRVLAEGEYISFGRPAGLALSGAVEQVSTGGGAGAAPVTDAPRAAAFPALIHHAEWGKTAEGGFIARRDALMAAAAAEGGEQTDGLSGPREARLAAARFLIGSRLNHEAVGLLNGMARKDARLLGDAEFRGLRGAALASIRRDRSAEADLGAPGLAADPAAALWRGLVAQRLGDLTRARSEFAMGARAVGLFDPAQRAVFARSLAEASLAQVDLAAAARAIASAEAEPATADERAPTLLLKARLLEAQGARPDALALYQRLATAKRESVAAPALLSATQLRLETGAMSPVEAAKLFAALRWRGRGGDTEVDAVRALAKAEADQGRWRESLAAYRALARSAPDTPSGTALLTEQGKLFRTLFLDGGADGLQPIQALGLFYDFRDQTPIGADGDLMVRRLARRLVDVDLLPQAVELLQYQVDNRLDGVAGAQVATDLALVQLMDRKPEAALAAIRNSRTTLLPAALNAERRLIEARALAELGRGEHALELLEGDASSEASQVRAEIAWKSRAWAQAGPALERSLGERWRSAAPLSAEEESRLMRAGAAYSLAGDEASLARLKGRYGKLTEGAKSRDALSVALAGPGETELAGSDFARAVSDADSFAAWVQAMKRRFREKPAPTA